MTIASRFNRCTGLRACVAASVLVAAASMLGGCSSSSKTSTKASASNMNAADMHTASPHDTYDGRYNYEYTSLVRGQTFSVRLPTNVGSHYDWRLSPESAKNKNFTLISRESQQVDAGEASVLHSRCWDIFTFRANRLGEANLTFIYEPPFLPNNHATREFTMTVDVGQPTKGMKVEHAHVTID